MSTRGSVLRVSSRALLDACARLGFDTGQILAAANLDPVTLQDPNARIPVEQVDALWRKAYERSNDPTLFSILDTHARMLLDQVPSASDLVGRVREAIQAELRGGSPQLESIAKRLAMSLVATLAPAPASAQQAGTSIIDLNPELTDIEFAAFAADVGSALPALPSIGGCEDAGTR